MADLGRVAAVIALAFTSSLATTAAPASDIARGRLLPPFEVFASIRSMDLEPLGAPMLRGGVYIVRALDDEEVPVRVTVDARTGRVLTVTELDPRDYYSGPGRVGAHPMPPGGVPQIPDYRPEYGSRPAPNYAARPMPPEAGPPPAAGPAAAAPRPKAAAVAARTPAPKPRPSQAAKKPAAETTASIPNAEARPGKSIPAPVAPSAARSASSGAAPAAAPAKAAETPAAAAKTETLNIPAQSFE